MKCQDLFSMKNKFEKKKNLKVFSAAVVIGALSANREQYTEVS